MRLLAAPLAFALVVLFCGCSADAPDDAGTAPAAADVDANGAPPPAPAESATASPAAPKQAVFADRRPLQAPLPEGLVVPVDFSVISDNTNAAGDLQQRSIAMDVYETDIDAMIERFAEGIRAAGYTEGGDVTTPRADTRVATFRRGRSSVSLLVVGDANGTFTEGATAVATLVLIAPKPEAAGAAGG